MNLHSALQRQLSRLNSNSRWLACQDAVGDRGGMDGGGDVVDAENVGSAEDGGGVGDGGGEFPCPHLRI